MLIVIYKININLFLESADFISVKWNITIDGQAVKELSRDFYDYIIKMRK